MQLQQTYGLSFRQQQLLVDQSSFVKSRFVIMATNCCLSNQHSNSSNCKQRNINTDLTWTLAHRNNSEIRRPTAEPVSLTPPGVFRIRTPAVAPQTIHFLRCCLICGLFAQESFKQHGIIRLARLTSDKWTQNQIAHILLYIPKAEQLSRIWCGRLGAGPTPSKLLER